MIGNHGNRTRRGPHRDNRVEHARSRAMLRQLALSIMSAFTLVASAAGQGHHGSNKGAIELGPGMSAITPTLLEIGQETNFFLEIAEQAGLDSEQTQALEQLVFESRVYYTQRAADLDVEEAEMRRLLTRDEIDLDAVLYRIQQVEAIQADLKMHNIESLLKAIQILTHEQHLALVTRAMAPGTPERVVDPARLRQQ